MKRIVLLTSVSVLALSVNIRAQEVTIETYKSEAEATRPRDQKLDLEQRAKAALQKKPLTYSGFLAETSRAEKKFRFLSLRQPRDSKNDVRNVAYEERTGRPRGFVLFRIEF